ncbi:hypothetical protein C8J56DRAFT_584108 [Mycena floridula]|nr:hypothetical protein C8J56DRAFT_584108 [Mycena floridula]
MTLFTTVIFLVLIWASIHGLHHLSKRSSSPLLPVDRQRRTVTHLTVQALHCRVQTTAWNTRHDILKDRLQRYSRLRNAFILFYDAGNVLGLLGMIVAVSLLLWTFFALVGDLIATEPRHHKRDLDSDFVKPIIPGVTVPLSDAPVILFAVFTCQVIHELGHAFAAAIDQVPIVAAGASFTIAIPSAFVTFSAASLQALAPTRRARIIAAGPWHNLVFWLLLLFAIQVHLDKWLLTVGYTNVNDLGRSVLSVESNSPLTGFLLEGSVVTKLDDIHIAGRDDVWTRYLTAKDPQAGGLGWCFDQKKYLESTEDCCTATSNPGASTSLLSCFTALHHTTHRCLDPLPILTKPLENKRCGSNTDCHEAFCIRPSSTAQLLRLTMVSPWENPQKEEVVLWSGPRKEVWEQVEVGEYLPRLFIFPGWTPRLMARILSYLQAASLSLFLFNLLPLPYLDGAQFLSVIVEIAFPNPRPPIIDLEEAITPISPISPRESRWKSRIGPFITRGLTIVFVLCAVLAINKVGLGYS